MRCYRVSSPSCQQTSLRTELTLCQLSKVTRFIFLFGKLKDFHETALYQEIYCFVMAGKRYPFYGVQWHPEVNRFQWYRKLNFPHSRHAVQLSSLLAEFFVNEGNMTSMHYQKTYTAQQN